MNLIVTRMALRRTRRCRSRQQSNRECDYRRLLTIGTDRALSDEMASLHVHMPSLLSPRRTMARRNSAPLPALNTVFNRTIGVKAPAAIHHYYWSARGMETGSNYDT